MQDYCKYAKSMNKALKLVINDANKWIDTSLCAHAHTWPIVMTIWVWVPL